jgi:uncharacterized membrane protein YczE
VHRKPLSLHPGAGVQQATGKELALVWQATSRRMDRVTTVDLRPLPLTSAPARRIPQLLGGLVLYGTSMAMQLRATLGLDPWDVFHQGLAHHLPLSFGLVTAVTGAAVLLLWIPLRQRPGIGTIANVIVIAVSVDAALAMIPQPTGLPVRAGLMVGGIVLNGVASAAYIGARLGPGPRDGLMTGLAARTGWSIRLDRTGIEVTVLAVGWLLGGTVGLGTVVYALAIGPLTQAFLPWFVIATPPRGPRASTDAPR